MELLTLNATTWLTCGSLFQALLADHPILVLTSDGEKCSCFWYSDTLEIAKLTTSDKCVHDAFMTVRMKASVPLSFDHSEKEGTYMTHCQYES